MTIEPVSARNLFQAAAVHSASWRDSHQDICSPAFVDLHDTAHQMQYILEESRQGKRFFLLSTARPVGIVSVKDNEIGDLYVLTEEQGKGYGTALLEYAISLCQSPTLWLLSTNERAHQLYSRMGFRPTGAEHPLSPQIHEVEMCRV